MKMRIMLSALMLTTLLGLMSISRPAIALDALAGATSFLASGYSYLPLQKVASFLGADLSWDVVKSQAVMNYQGKNLVLTPNNLTAMFDGNQLALPTPPVVVNGRTYVPAVTLKKTYGVPIEWDSANSQMSVKGPNGWSKVDVKRRPPWHGGPPPWAPAWGARSKKDVKIHHPQPVTHQKPVKKYDEKKDKKHKK